MTGSTTKAQLQRLQGLTLQRLKGSTRNARGKDVYLDRRMVAVQAVQVALLLAGQGGRGRGGGLRRRRHRGLQPRREGAAARPGARLTIQQPAARRNVNTNNTTHSKYPQQDKTSFTPNFEMQYKSSEQNKTEHLPETWGSKKQAALLMRNTTP